VEFHFPFGPSILASMDFFESFSHFTSAWRGLIAAASYPLHMT
jgi:hypothetical protein